MSKAAKKEDGSFKIPIAIIDALIPSRLGSSEMRIVTFIITRTYGSATDETIDGDLYDAITAEMFSKATGVNKNNVRKCLRQLRRKKVINSRKISIDNYMEYGINTNVAEWETC